MNNYTHLRNIALAFILVFGNLTLVKAQYGSLDTSFDTDGWNNNSVTNSTHLSYGITESITGKIATVGAVNDGTNDVGFVTQWNADGSVDTGFDTDGILTILPSGASNCFLRGVAYQLDGKIVAVGRADIGGDNRMYVFRFNTDGTLDTSFDTDGMQEIDFSGTSLAGDYRAFQEINVYVQDDGSIIALTIGQDAGYFIAAAKFTPNGALDNSFGTNGVSENTCPDTGYLGFSSCLLSSGKIVVAYSNYATIDIGLLNADGTMDTGFDTDGFMTVLLPGGADLAAINGIGEHQGKIMLGFGRCTGNGNGEPTSAAYIKRFNLDGTEDATWNGGLLTTDALSTMRSTDRDFLVINDKPLFVGYNTLAVGGQQVLKLNVDGTADVNWAPSGQSNNTVGSDNVNRTAAAMINRTGGLVTAVMSHNGVEYATGVSRYAAAFSITNATCAGHADGVLSYNEGTDTPYSYVWSNGETTQTISGLVAGTYFVTITGGSGTIITMSETVNNNVLTAYTTVTDVSCNGASDGSVEVAVYGGTSPYVYSWDNSGSTIGSLTGLSPNTYSATITDANSCTVTMSSTVAEPSELLVAVNIDSNVSCTGLSDGGATAVVIGGTSPYTYTWSNGDSNMSISNVPAGIYSLTVTDTNGCSNDSVIEITEPNVVANPGFTGMCVGDSVQLTGTGALTYVWNSGLSDGDYVSPIITTNYVVTGTDSNGCISSDTLNLLVHSNPVVNIQSLPQDTICLATTDITLAGTPTGGMFEGLGVTGNVFDVGFAGVGEHDIVYTFIDTNGCEASDTLKITVDACTAIPEAETTLFNFDLYPNPNNGSFTIEYGQKGINQVQVIDLTGKVVYGEVTAMKTTFINLELATGVYFVEVINNENVTIEKVVVK